VGRERFLAMLGSKVLPAVSDAAITPDGPRGPRYSLGQGAVSLAQLTATPIVPMHCEVFATFPYEELGRLHHSIAFFKALSHRRRPHTRARIE
jgi:hypothetical protein